jgi:dolichol-phosphate mannosyltransferase
VGIAGFGVQLASLATLEHGTAWPEWTCVAAAVAVTVSHNFLWHERVTWKTRAWPGRWRRWLAFNLSNGAVSIAANVLVTAALTSAAGVPLLAANAAAVLAASLLNFAISDRVVFRKARCRPADSSHACGYFAASPLINRYWNSSPS